MPRNLQNIHENILFPAKPNNPYVANFDEDEEEDIIKVKVADPEEAYYYDEHGKETIELKEQDPNENKLKESGQIEIFVKEDSITEADILADAAKWEQSQDCTNT